MTTQYDNVKDGFALAKEVLQAVGDINETFRIEWFTVHGNIGSRTEHYDQALGTIAYIIIEETTVFDRLTSRNGSTIVLSGGDLPTFKITVELA